MTSRVLGNPPVTAALSLGVAAFVILAVIFDAVPWIEAWVDADRDIHAWFFRNRTPWLTHVMVFVADLVDWIGALLLVGLFSALALRRGRRHEALFMVLTAAGAYGFSLLAKEIVGRVRPDVTFHVVVIDNPSFPSGHAVHSVAFYGAAAVLVHRWSRIRAIWLAGIVAFLALLIGISRVYLGMHWPTDVFGGWVLGACWLIFSWSMFRWWELRRTSSKVRVGLGH